MKHMDAEDFALSDFPAVLGFDDRVDRVHLIVHKAGFATDLLWWSGHNQSSLSSRFRQVAPQS